MPGVKGLTPFAKQCFVTVAICCNLIGHGCVMGFTAVLLPQLHQPDPDILLSKDADSWIASVIGITLMIGSFMVTPIMGRLGRKAAHYTITVAAIGGWIITILATSVEALLIGRIVQGLSFGMMLPLRSILIGEYTSPKNRGAFLTTVSLAQGSGIFFVHLIGSFLSWQRTALVCMFFPIGSLFMTLFTPESPSWLADKGKYEECRKTFRWLRGDEEQAEVEDLIAARKFANANRNEHKVLDTIKDKAFYKPITLMIHVYALSQFAGATSMAAYSIMIIRLIMGPDANAHFWMIALDAQRILVNFLAIFIINRFNRRTMMFSTGAVCVASHLAIVVYVYLKKEGILQYPHIWLPGLLIVLQFFSVAVGIAPLASVVAGEVFPLQYRSIGGSFSLVVLAGTLFLVLKTYPGLVASVGIDGSYAIYAGALTYCLVVAWFLLPETKGRTLQEIEDEFTGRRVVVQDEEKSLKEDDKLENNV